MPEHDPDRSCVRHLLSEDQWEDDQRLTTLSRRVEELEKELVAARGRIDYAERYVARQAGVIKAAEQLHAEQARRMREMEDVLAFRRMMIDNLSARVDRLAKENPPEDYIQGKEAEAP